MEETDRHHKIMYSDTQQMLISLLINQPNTNYISDTDLIKMKDDAKQNRENKNY